MIPTHSVSGSTFSDPLPHLNSCSITDFTIPVAGSTVRPNAGTEPTVSRWRTREFYLYGVAFLLVVPVLVWWPMRLSLRVSFLL